MMVLIIKDIKNEETAEYQYNGLKVFIKCKNKIYIKFEAENEEFEMIKDVSKFSRIISFYTEKNNNPYEEIIFNPSDIMYYINKYEMTHAIYEDKECHTQASEDYEYVIEYYYEYSQGALIYRIQKQRFNGLFSLEGKFYSKDENEGINYTNLIYMPKVRVVSDINLRLGEKADPTMSVFNIIGMPETVGANRSGLIMQVTRLNSDIDYM